MNWNEIEGDLVDILPACKALKKLPDVVVRTVALRHSRRIGIGFSAGFLAEIGEPTRVSVKLNAKRMVLVVQADDLRGKFEPAKIGRYGKLSYIRIPVPDGLFWREGLEEPEYWIDAPGRRLAMEVPGFLAPAPVTARPASAAPLVALAKASVPAPDFGARKPGK